MRMSVIEEVLCYTYISIMAIIVMMLVNSLRAFIRRKATEHKMWNIKYTEELMRFIKKLIADEFVKRKKISLISGHVDIKKEANVENTIAEVSTAVFEALENDFIEYDTVVKKEYLMQMIQSETSILVLEFIKNAN